MCLPNAKWLSFWVTVWTFIFWATMSGLLLFLPNMTFVANLWPHESYSLCVNYLFSFLIKNSVSFFQCNTLLSYIKHIYIYYFIESNKNLGSDDRNQLTHVFMTYSTYTYIHIYALYIFMYTHEQNQNHDTIFYTFCNLLYTCFI